METSTGKEPCENYGAGKDWVRIEPRSGTYPDLPMWKSEVTYGKKHEIDGKLYQRQFQGDGSQPSDYLWEVVDHNSSYNDWDSEVEGYGSSWQAHWNTISGDAEYEDLQYWDSTTDLNNTIVVNAALKQRTLQSSTAFSGYSARSVDGNTDGAYANLSVSHTESEERGWWQVDLGADYTITSVNIHNRTDTCDGCQDRLRDFYILISRSSMAEFPMSQQTYELLTDVNNTDVWRYYYNGIFPAQKEINVTGGFQGRFVMIVLSGETEITPLSLAEVEVMVSMPKIEVLSNTNSDWQRIAAGPYKEISTGRMFSSYYWEQLWREISGDYPVGIDTVENVATEWEAGKYFETSQSTTATFDSVTLDTSDIELEKTDAVWRGSETGRLTVRPEKIRNDYDVFEFRLTESGLLTVETKDCSPGEKSEVKIYNSLGGRIDTIGVYEHLTDGNYRINQINAAGSGAQDFIAHPGTYYAKVQVHPETNTKSGDSDVFEYSIHITCDTSHGEDHGDVKELATLLTKWETHDSPLGYFRQETGVAGGATDKDYFRFDVPGNAEYLHGAWIRIMANTDNIAVRLLNSGGGQIAPKPPGTATVLVTDPYALDDFTDALEKHLETGTYYIEVTSVPDSDVPYKLDVDLDDYGNLYNANPKPFTGYNNIPGHLETVSPTTPDAGADKDVFALETVSSARYVIYTEGTTDTSARILDSSGQPVTLGDDYEEDIAPGSGNMNFSITKSDFSTGTFYIEVTEKNGRVGDYRLFINLEDDYSNRYDCHVWNASGGEYGLDVCNPSIGTLANNVTGVINQPGDIDFFRYDTGTSPGAGRLTIVSDSSIDTGGELYEYDETTGRARMCAMNSDGAGDSVGNFKIEYDVKVNTTYLLKVKARLLNATGGYKLNVAQSAPGAGHSMDEEGDSYNDAEDLFPTGLSDANPSGSYSGGGIDLAGDNDYYWFDVAGTGVLRVWTETSGAYTDTFGYLYVLTGADTNGDHGLSELVAMNDDDPEVQGYKDGNFSIRYYVDGSHKYSETDGSTAGVPAGLPITRFFVRVKGLSDSTIGDYVLKFSLDTSEQDAEGDSCTTAKAVGPDQHPGEIDLAGDIDFFRFVLGPEVAGTTITPGSLNAYSTSNNSLDLFGYLKNYMCSTLLMDDNSGDGENFSLDWQQVSPDPDIHPPPEPVTFYNPEVYYVSLRDYEGVNVDPYTLTIDSNGTFIDFEKSANWAPEVAGSHYFGFEVPPTASTLSITCTNSPVATDFILLSGEGGVTSEVDDVVNDDTGNNFTIHHADIAPGFYYVMVTPTGTSTDPMTISVDRWRWKDGIFTDSTGSAGAFNTLGRLVNATVFDMEATGTDIQGTSDSGYFAWRTVTGDFDISGRMTIIGSGDDWAKVGPMVRKTNDHDSVNLFAAYADTHGSSIQYRLANEGDTSAPTELTDNNSGNRYVRLVRSGNTVTAYKSNDGDNWVYVYQTDVFTGDVLVGFAATSHASTSRSFRIEAIKFSTKVSDY